MKSFQVRKRVAIVLIAVVLLITFTAQPELSSFKIPSDIRSLKDVVSPTKISSPQKEMKTLEQKKNLAAMSQNGFTSKEAVDLKNVEDKTTDKADGDSMARGTDVTDVKTRPSMKKDQNVNNAVTALREFNSVKTKDEDKKTDLNDKKVKEPISSKINIIAINQKNQQATLARLEI